MNGGPIGATIVISGDKATLCIGSQNFRMPATAVNMSGGKVWVELAAELAVGIDKETVTVLAMHPEPTIEQFMTWLDSVNPLIVAGLMAQESAWGSMEDSIGLVALRAVSRALRGELPEQVPDMSGLE